MAIKFSVEPTGWLIGRDEETVVSQFDRFVGGLGPWLERNGVNAKVTGNNETREVEVAIDDISNILRERIGIVAGHDGLKVNGL